MMYFKKIEINNLKIVAPLKCGTRWLHEKSEKSSYINIEDLKEETDSETIFLYREPKDHLISALQTDYILNECDLNKTLNDLLNNRSTHWRGDMYEYTHMDWCYNKFKMVNYLNICDLIGDYDFDKKKYDFSKEPYLFTKEMVLDLVPIDVKEELFKMADNNEYWLKQIQEKNDKIASKIVLDKLNDTILENQKIDKLNHIMLEYQKVDKKNIFDLESVVLNKESIILNYESVIKKNYIIMEDYRKNYVKKSLL